MAIEYREGDLIEYLKEYAEAWPNEVIATAHGCNCHNKMGSGYAPLLAKAFPEVLDADTRLYNECVERYAGFGGNELMLGWYSNTRINDCIEVFNLYTQFYPGKDLRMESLRDAFSRMNDYCKHDGIETLHIPLIGAGIAGGVWKDIAKVIEEQTQDLDVVVWYLPGQKPEI